MPASGPDVLAPPRRDPGQKFWDPEIQTLAPERRRALQDERVRTLIRRCFETPVPHYTRKFAAAGLASPDDVKGVEDLANIPLTEWWTSGARWMGSAVDMTRSAVTSASRSDRSPGVLRVILARTPVR